MTIDMCKCYCAYGGPRHSVTTDINTYHEGRGDGELHTGGLRLGGGWELRARELVVPTTSWQPGTQGRWNLKTHRLSK